ncbi:MAG: hypothetical protein GY805_22935 [Chloroflexi bacterium]|nr:hypothetical protein [Chloroflexota bacterium]
MSIVAGNEVEVGDGNISRDASVGSGASGGVQPIKTHNVKNEINNEPNVFLYF